MYSGIVVSWHVPDIPKNAVTLPSDLPELDKYNKQVWLKLLHDTLQESTLHLSRFFYSAHAHVHIASYDS